MSDEYRRCRPWLGTRALVVVAGLGLAAALAYALLPVHQESYSYSFRPIEASMEPAVAVLPLARSTPDTFDLLLPCDRPGSSFRSLSFEDWSSPDPGARALQSPLRFRDVGPGLTVSVGEGVVAVSLGDDEVLRAQVDHEPGCEVAIEYADGEWRLAVPGDELRLQAPGPRIAEARFSGPAASDEATAVTVTTRELGSSPTPIQWALLVVAVGPILVVWREVVARTGSSGPRRRKPGWARTVLGRIRLVDVVVLATLVLWVVIIPPFFDDGWEVARSRAYSDYGGFSTIYAADAAVFPFGYWFQMSQYLWFGLSSAPVIMRLSVLLIGAGTWIGLRSVARSLDVARRGPSIWLMGGVFVVGFGAWGSLRPEPVIAALVLASLALAIRFRNGERGWVLVAWLAVVALAVTTHPAGVVAGAPVIVSWRRLWEWARTDREARSVAAASLLTLLALTLVLLFFDSNLRTTLESYDASTGHSLGVFDEPERYRLLTGNDEESQFGTVIRRAQVGLMLVAAGGFLIRRLGGRRRMGDIAGWTLVAGLVLLSLTPSKWPWHFGGLLAVAALVAALEFREPEPASSRLGRAHPAVVAAGLVLVMAWAWSVPAPSWTAFDLRTQRWWEGATNFLPFDLSQVGVWAGLAGAISLLVWGRRRWWGRAEGWSTPTGLGILATALVVSVTAVTFGLDVVRTDGWTFGRQNINAAVGGGGCGLGDEVQVPIPGSLHRLASTDDGSVEADLVADAAGFYRSAGFEPGAFPRYGINEVRPVPDLGDIGSWVEFDGQSATATQGNHRSRWYRLAAGDDLVALTVMGTYGDGIATVVAVQWGTAMGAGITDLGVAEVTPSGNFTDWTLLTVDPPPDADRVRLLLRDATGSGWVASSSPLGLSTATLADVAAGGAAVSVVPPLLLYTPCVGVPVIERGVVAPPGMMVLRSRWLDGRIAWPPAPDPSTYDSALSTDRYFRLTSIVPPRQLADAVLLVMSQEYLTGRPARANGEFLLDR